MCSERDFSCSVLPVKQQQQPKNPHPILGVHTELFSELGYEDAIALVLK